MQIGVLLFPKVLYWFLVAEADEDAATCHKIYA